MEVLGTPSRTSRFQITLPSLVDLSNSRVTDAAVTTQRRRIPISADRFGETRPYSPGRPVRVHNTQPI